ncbi:MAG: hypothetical protein IJX36_00620, partial [Thermoguttaceae bacterium]|nr:hypothetical protein [Thermoguttaceae bacterium]
GKIVIIGGVVRAVARPKGRRRRSVYPAFPFCLFVRFWSSFSFMSALLLLPLAATSVGGAIALGALFHYFNGSNDGARSLATEPATPGKFLQVEETSTVSAIEKTVREERERSERAVAELERRRRELADFYARANAELEARRATLETLTAQATEVAATLGRVLDSFSTAFGASSENGASREKPRRNRPISKRLTPSTVESRRAADAFEPLFALEDELRWELGEARGLTAR